MSKVFLHVPEEVAYVYEENTGNKEQQRILSEKIQITFHEGFPVDSKVLTNGGLFREGERDKNSHRLLVLEDVYGEAVASKHLARFSTVYAHHQVR